MKGLFFVVALAVSFASAEYLTLSSLPPLSPVPPRPKFNKRNVGLLAADSYKASDVPMVLPFLPLQEVLLKVKCGHFDGHHLANIILRYSRTFEDAIVVGAKYSSVCEGGLAHGLVEDLLEKMVEIVVERISPGSVRSVTAMAHSGVSDLEDKLDSISSHGGHGHASGHVEPAMHGSHEENHDHQTRDFTAVAPTGKHERETFLRQYTSLARAICEGLNKYNPSFLLNEPLYSCAHAVGHSIYGVYEIEKPPTNGTFPGRGGDVGMFLCREVWDPTEDLISFNECVTGIMMRLRDNLQENEGINDRSIEEMEKIAKKGVEQLKPLNKNVATMLSTVMKEKRSPKYREGLLAAMYLANDGCAGIPVPAGCYMFLFQKLARLLAPAVTNQKAAGVLLQHCLGFQKGPGVGEDNRLMLHCIYGLGYGMGDGFLKVDLNFGIDMIVANTPGAQKNTDEIVKFFISSWVTSLFRIGGKATKSCQALLSNSVLYEDCMISFYHEQYHTTDSAIAKTLTRQKETHLRLLDKAFENIYFE